MEEGIQEFGLPVGLFKQGDLGIDLLGPILLKYFHHYKMPYYDPCCKIISEIGLPVSYKDNKLQYYDIISKELTEILIGTGGGTVSRFGIEDNLGIQDRIIDFSNYKLELNHINKFFVGSGNSVSSANTVGQFVSDFSVYDNAIDIQSYSGNLVDYSDVYVYSQGAYLYSSRGNGSGANRNAYTYFNVYPEVINTVQKNNDVLSSLMFPFLDTSARAATYLALSVNGNYADAAGNVTIAVANPVIPFYNNNLDAIMSGAVQDSTYRLPYLMPGDYYPLALVGPLQEQTFSLTIPPNCNINTLSATIQMTNTITNTVYNFTTTRSSIIVGFNAITVTVLQGPYSFSIGPL